MSKLRFKVIHCTSEEHEYPASELNEHSPNTKGWQSARYCDYPQEIGIEFPDGESFISQLQVLSHHFKIATKIDIYVGQGSSYQTATYKRLGYIGLDSNERSNFQSRELKTAYIENSGRYVRLLVRQCHVNKSNVYSQVGLVAINLVGAQDSVPNEARSKRDNEDDVKGSVRRHVPPSKSSLSDLSNDLNLDPHTANILRSLSDAKARAVESEDYLTAKQIKVIENELKELGVRMAQLEVAKRKAVNDEDYDRAALLKEETEELRTEIQNKVRKVNIPGVMDNASVSKPKASRAQANRGNTTNSLDDVVVGGGQNTSANNSGPPSSNRERPQKYNHTEDEEDTSANADAAPATFLEEEEYGDRPIRPKANLVYDDKDPEVEGSELSPRHVVNFAPGQHPLEGVPNCSELPAPDSGLSKKSGEVASKYNIISLLGEYRTFCLFSKVWALREAAIYKTRLLLASDFQRDPGISACFGSLAGVVQVGVEDKITQVFFISLGLLEDMLGYVSRDRLAKSSVGPLLEPIVGLLIEKLADGAGRIRDGARTSIEALAASPGLGPGVVSNHAIRAIPDKLKSSWRLVLGRLQLLNDLVIAYGVGSNGLQTDGILNFLKNLNVSAHSNGDVRDAGKDLVASLYKVVGMAPLENYLSQLRKKQREEYEAAFGLSGDGNSAAAVPPAKSVPSSNAPKNVSEEKSSKPPASKHQQTPGGGAVQTAASKAGKKDAPSDMHNGAKGAEGEDFTICMFCGKKDKSWNEDGLDLHYWKECPLLAPCPACAQIVEIAGLPEHLLDECEHRNAYAACTVTGLAIRKDETDMWRRSPNYVAPPDSCMYCPLCLASVEDTDEAWKQHLLYGCPKNMRARP